MTTDDKKASKSVGIFQCEICDVVCSRKCDMNRHKTTTKHKMNDKMITNDDAKTKKASEEYICKCGKKYKYRQGIWKHKQLCIAYNNLDNKLDNNLDNKYSNNNVCDKDLIMLLIKENSELKSMMMEVIKNGTNNNINTNSHNKTFNLNVFLNETCKNAMNITEFADSVKLQLSDLENMGNVGFVNGISDIIIKNLKQLDITERPVHCTDVKRDVVYVKDENIWEKENQSNDKLRKVVKAVAHKNTKMLRFFKEKYPDCGKSESKKSEQYNKLVIEAMGGKGDNNLEKEDKIIKKITREVVIDKMNN